MAGRVAGKVVVITGAASGMGAATARLMAAEGASVVLADIQDDPGQELAKEIGGQATFVHCDVSREEDVAAAVDIAGREFGRLDVMFNNAGILGAIGPIDDIPVEEYEFTMGVLLRSVFLGMKHAARVMKPQQSGVILSTSSIAGIMGAIGPHCYAAAKAAILGLTRNVAAELGPWGIRVVAIVPGSHATPMSAALIVGDHTAVDETVELNRASRTPLRDRPGVAADVAHAALWLASDEAGFVSGTGLVVDGGFTTGSKNGVEPGRVPFAVRRPVLREAGQTGL